mgnify:CR=1 FL=1
MIERPRPKQAVLTRIRAIGLVGAVAWLTSSPMQKVFGWLRDTTGSFKIGLAVVGWLPLIALALIVLFWPKDKTTDESQS